MKKKTKSTAVFIISALAAGGLSALVTSGSMSLFDEINKPPLTPPPTVFPIVWTILFVLMGISAARIYLRDPKSAALKIYIANLAVNFLWTVIFFNMRAFLLAFAWLVLLIAVVASMIVHFFRLDRTSALLQLPYAAWLIFAGYLNLFICLINTR